MFAVFENAKARLAFIAADAQQLRDVIMVTLGEHLGLVDEVHGLNRVLCSQVFHHDQLGLPTAAFGGQVSQLHFTKQTSSQQTFLQHKVAPTIRLHKTTQQAHGGGDGDGGGGGKSQIKSQHCLANAGCSGNLS
jgi:hypothetical protein